MPRPVILQIVYEAPEIVAIFLLGVRVKLPVGQVHHVGPASVRHRLPLEISSHSHSHRAQSLYSSGLGDLTLTKESQRVRPAPQLRVVHLLCTTRMSLGAYFDRGTQVAGRACVCILGVEPCVLCAAGPLWLHWCSAACACRAAQQHMSYTMALEGRWRASTHTAQGRQKNRELEEKYSYGG